MQNMPIVKILADSISNNKRITTFQLEYWRAILPELNTHRVFSRSSRSSRATPIERNIQQVKTNPWGPRHWNMNQKGMQGIDKPLTNEEISQFEYEWTKAAKEAAKQAENLNMLGLHKQIVNRVLEPFMSIQTVLTATEFDNFYELRISPLAQPEMRDLAESMKIAQDSSEPQILTYEEWHLPYISEREKELYPVDILKKVSAARCARVSYKLFNGSTSVEDDLMLAKHLLENKHMSPFEHQATPVGGDDDGYYVSNLIGWNQLRKYYEA